MKFAMCNEFCVDWSLDETFALAAEAGYTGVELAPYTLGPSVDQINATTRRAVRNAAQKHGMEVAGLHWLLARTEGLHINHPDAEIRRRTIAYYKRLIELCAELGGDRMIHGSPAQRDVIENDDPAAAMDRTVAFFEAVAPAAEAHGVTVCPEPLAQSETNLLNTKDEAAALIERVNHPNVRLILDCKAMGDEDKPAAQIIREAAPLLHHFHANDDNLSYPGSGTYDFDSILQALTHISYTGWVSVEVFDFTVDPREVAIEGLKHLRKGLQRVSQ